jgi:glycosyltransferase involved in cell wall biosynthesis
MKNKSTVDNGNKRIEVKYKILFITWTHSGGGGAENVLTTLVNNLSVEKYEIDIIEIQQFSVKTEPIRSEVTLLPPLSRADHDPLSPIIYQLLYNRPETIKPLFNLYGYDIVVTWNYQLPSFCLRSFLSEIKIAWFHSDIYDLLPSKNDLQIEIRRQLQIMAWENADKIVTISKKSLKSLEDVFPFFSKKSYVIHNGVDINKTRTSVNVDSNILLLANEKNMIVGIGRLDQRKNFELLIRAVSKVIHSGIECSLVIIGAGELRDRLENIAFEEHIDKQVFFTGYQINPYPYLRKSKALCLTSFSEGWPTVVVEAMILGKPFVTTPVAGASEELSCNGECGLVSQWDIDEYSECIKKLLTDDILYGKMSKRCIEEVKKYDIANTVKQFDMFIAEFSTKEHHLKENNPIYSRRKAIFYFAYLYSLRKKVDINFALNRLKNDIQIINMVKLGYRFFHLFINGITFPIGFLVGLYHGTLLGTRGKVCRH